MHTLLIVLAVWTVLWVIACAFWQNSEYGPSITWMARILLYVFPLFIAYNMCRKAFGVKTEAEKIAEEFNVNRR